MHSKATIGRWVSAVQERTGLYATRIPILGFPQQKQQKRHCSTGQHECCKPTNANKTPQMPRRFYLRPRLLCHLTLCNLFTSSCFVVLQSPALESALTPQIIHRFGAPIDPPPSKWRCKHLFYPVAFAVVVFVAEMCHPPKIPQRQRNSNRTGFQWVPVENPSNLTWHPLLTRFFSRCWPLLEMQWVH